MPGRIIFSCFDTTTKCLYMIIKKAENPYIVFDLDDTLFPELEYLKSAYKEIASQIPGDPVEINARMFERYRSGANVFEWLMNEYGGRVEGLTVQKLIQ